MTSILDLGLARVRSGSGLDNFGSGSGLFRSGPNRQVRVYFETSPDLVQLWFGSGLDIFRSGFGSSFGSLLGPLFSSHIFICFFRKRLEPYNKLTILNELLQLKCMQFNHAKL